MRSNRFMSALLVLAIAALGCTLPSGVAGADLEVTPTFTVVPDTATPTATTDSSLPPPADTGPSTTCTPTATANSPVNVRSGPGTVYSVIDTLTKDQVVTVTGKNSEGTWWVINRPSGGTGWVAASVVTTACIQPDLAVVAAPPTPKPASGTCKDDYVWRLINSGDKVCVTPASKAQADADNAAADSRKATATYGPDTCISGYVWREAFSGDHVCVTPDVRTQAAADNAAAAARIDPLGPWGPDSCVVGYVWREASPTDHVCVTPAVRSQAAADNAAAASRKVTSLYGPDTCATGFVWREAFSGDHVCVTPDVRTQTAADNAAAPSHTWP